MLRAQQQEQQRELEKRKMYIKAWSIFLHTYSKFFKNSTQYRYNQNDI